MNESGLVAPEVYNLTNEIERFTKSPEHIALKWLNEDGEKKELSYQQLFSQVNRLANVLSSQGLEKGDRVLVMLPRITEAYVAYIACLKAGLVVVPCSEMLKPRI